MAALAEFDAAFESNVREVDTYDMVKAFGITVPQTAGPRCMFPHRSGWICSRAEGHKGRHVATIVGAVCAVWRADR